MDELLPSGVSHTTSIRQPLRGFKITGGTNPYSAQEVRVDDVTGVVTTNDQGITLTASGTAGLLWELNNDTTVPTDGTVVVSAWPNPAGPGFLFDAGRAIPCPPPPPPPATPGWYCIGGVAVYVGTGGTVPGKSDCGPFDSKPDCATCTPITASGGIGATDGTAYAGPYTVGGTLALSLSKTGAFTGTPTWYVYPIEPVEATNSGTDTGTGNTFGPSIGFITPVASSTGFRVLITDSGDPTKTGLATVAAAQVINPAAISVRSGAGNLTDDDAFQRTPANTPGGGFTLTLTVSAKNRGKSWWLVENTGTGNLTINQTGGETINGAASITVAAGAHVTLYPDNLSTWKAL